MGRYISWTDVLNRYKAAETYGDATTMEAAYIAPVEDRIDGYLARRYAVPFCNTPSLAPGIVRDMCIDLTYIKITEGKVPTVEIQAALTQTIADILNNKLTLIVNGTVMEADAITSIDSTASPAGTMYGWDEPANWDVSSNWEQATQDERLAT